jgi:hypothetical protein
VIPLLKEIHMSTKYYWYSLSPSHFGTELCVNMKHWEFPVDEVITHCRKNIDVTLVIDEYRRTYTGRKFLERMGVEEGDGEGEEPRCDIEGCNEPCAPHAIHCHPHVVELCTKGPA